MGLLKPNITGMRANGDIRGLNKYLGDKDPSVRVDAAKALAVLARKKIGKKSSIPHLNKCLADRDPRVRFSAAYALRNLAGSKIGDRSSIPILNKALSDKNPKTRTVAAYALGYLAEIRIGASSSIPKLNICFDDADENTRANIAYVLGALAKMKIGRPSSIPILNDCLDDRNTGVRTSAAFALAHLAEMKIGDPGSIRPLNKCLNSKNMDLRATSAYVISSLAKIKIGKATSIPLLNKCLNSKDIKVRQNAIGGIAALAKLDFKYASSIPYLARSLHDPDPNVRSWTAFALGAVGNEDAAEALIQALSDHDQNVTGNVVFALGEISAALAVESLKKLINDRKKCDLIDMDETIRSTIGEEAWKAIVKIMGREVKEWLFSINAMEPESKLNMAIVSQLIPVYDEMVKLKTFPAIREMKMKMGAKLSSLEFAGKKYMELSKRDSRAGKDASELLKQNEMETNEVRRYFAELEGLEIEVEGIIQELEDRTTILVLNSRLTGSLDEDVLNDVLMSTLERERYIEDKLNETVLASGLKLKKKEKEKIKIPDIVLVPAGPRPSVKPRRKLVRKVSDHGRHTGSPDYYGRKDTGRTSISSTMRKLKGSSRWNDDLWKRALDGWKEEGSDEIISIIETLNEEHLNDLIRLISADKNTCRNLANLIEKWNSSKYYRWYEAGERIIEVKTGYLGGLYGLCQLLLFKELKMYPENERYFELVLKMYRKPENRYYNFPKIKTETDTHDDESIIVFSVK